MLQGNLTVGQEEERFLGKEDRVVLEGDAACGSAGGEEVPNGSRLCVFILHRSFTSPDSQTVSALHEFIRK